MTTEAESTVNAATATTGKKMPAWLRWALATLAVVALLSIVQSVTGTQRLTAVSTSREMLRWAVPIFLAGLGGLFSERAGVVNIGLEGMMIFGMWSGAWGALEFGPWIGLLVGVAGGALGGLLHALATVTFGVDQIISGVAINILAPGLTRFLSREIWDKPTQSPATPSLGDWNVPFLAGGEIFGWKSPDLLRALGKQDIWFISDLANLSRGLLRGTSILAIFAVALVPIVSWVIWKTRFGLRLRFCGEHPKAAEAQGINVYLYKYYAVVISGALAGLGGVFISSPELSGQFLEGNSNGRGYIGLAALIFGNWRPVGVLAGALLFGYVFGVDLKDLDGTASHALLLAQSIVLATVALWALRKRRIVDAVLAAGLSGGAAIWWALTDSVPDWWSNILPYVIVLLVLIFFSQRLRVPAFLGQPYRRGA